MLIGELSKQTGFSTDTIRYYEKIGLIVLPKKKRLDRSYKDYPGYVVDVLQAIRKYKELGFTLEEIRELIILRSIQVPDISKLLDVVEIKIAGVNAELEKLHEMKLRLNRERQLLLHQRTGHTIALPEMRAAA